MPNELNYLMQKDNWTDNSVDFIISDIIEYDMQRGGLSIIKEKNLLDIDIIKSLECMEKRKANREVGLLQKKNKVLRDGLINGFKEYRIRFAQENLLKPQDILSIKKDAIFVKRFCQTLEFDKFIMFRQKNTYTAYLHLNEFEFYYCEDRLDVKGLGRNAQKHENYMTSLIKKFLYFLTLYDIEGAKKFLVKQMNEYKYRRLDIGYYREYNSLSAYSLFNHETNEIMFIEGIGQSKLSECIIDYNYNHIFIPLLSYLT